MLGFLWVTQEPLFFLNCKIIFISPHFY
jgi:hypothetical protein